MGLEKLPVIGGLFDDSDDQAKAIYQQILNQYQNLQVPNMPWQEYAPEEIGLAGTYSPEMMLGREITERPELLSQQQAYLAQLKDLSEKGLSDVDQAAFEQARQQAGQMARGSREALQSQMAARGMGGSGQELLSKELANQQAAERARASAMEQAAQSARQRALYAQAYGGELAGQRAADVSTAAKNVDIINAFNQMNTQARNQAAQQNLATRQALMGQNVQGRNLAQQYNIEGRRGAAQQAFANQLAKLQGMTGAQGTQAKAELAQGEANRASRAGFGQAVGAGIGYAYDGPEGAKVGSSIGGGLGGM